MWDAYETLYILDICDNYMKRKSIKSRLLLLYRQIKKNHIVLEEAGDNVNCCWESQTHKLKD